MHRPARVFGLRWADWVHLTSLSNELGFERVEELGARCSLGVFGGRICCHIATQCEECSNLDVEFARAPCVARCVAQTVQKTAVAMTTTLICEIALVSSLNMFHLMPSVKTQVPGFECKWAGGSEGNEMSAPQLCRAFSPRGDGVLGAKHNVGNQDEADWIKCSDSHLEQLQKTPTLRQPSKAESTHPICDVFDIFTAFFGLAGAASVSDASAALNSCLRWKLDEVLHKPKNQLKTTHWHWSWADAFDVGAEASPPQESEVRRWQLSKAWPWPNEDPTLAVVAARRAPAATNEVRLENLVSCAIKRNTYSKKVPHVLNSFTSSYISCHVWVIHVVLFACLSKNSK